MALRANRPSIFLRGAALPLKRGKAAAAGRGEEGGRVRGRQGPWWPKAMQGRRMKRKATHDTRACILGTRLGP